VNAVSEDIKAVLVAAAVGTFIADSAFDPSSEWGIACEVEPIAPDRVITVFSTGGPEPWTVQNGAIAPVEHPTFQIRVRGRSTHAAYTKVRGVMSALDRIGAWRTGDTKYEDIFRSSEPIPLGRDARDLFIWTVNYRTHRKDVS